MLWPCISEAELLQAVAPVQQTAVLNLRWARWLKLLQYMRCCETFAHFARRSVGWLPAWLRLAHSLAFTLNE